MAFIIFAAVLIAMFVASFQLPKGRAAMQVVTALLFVVVTLMFSVITVDAGQVKVTKLFGAVQEGYYPEGLHVINPMMSTVTMDTRRRVIEFTGNDAISALAADKVKLTVDASMPYVLNPRMAWKVLQRYGRNYEYALVFQAARSALRDAVSAMPWERATSEQGRAELAASISENFSRVLVADMVTAGFDEEDAKTAFSFPNAQVRRTLPPNRILDAIAEEQASEADLRRQKTLTEIARQEAERRANDGLGVKLMMEALPKNFEVDEMVSIINANAAKTNSEAFMKSVEAGNPNITVVVSGAAETPDIAVPAGR